MEYSPYLSLIMVTYALCSGHELMRFDRKFFKSCVLLLLCVTMPFRLAELSTGWIPVSKGVMALTSLDVTQLFSVWWEDGMFVLPAAYLLSHWLPNFKDARDLEMVPNWTYQAARVFAYGVTIALCLCFASGHAYQGWVGAFSLLYFNLFLWCSRKYGVLTSMACHIAYDVSTQIVLQIFVYLQCHKGIF
jgi:hypothetical protein